VIVPPALRALFVDKIVSKHRRALPAVLETGRVYRPEDPEARGDFATLRVRVEHEGGELYLDYYTESDELSAHRRIHADGRVTDLDNYRGTYGRVDPAEAQHIREHNARVEALLQQKGFLDR
jgi:hypothetical protein